MLDKFIDSLDIRLSKSYFLEVCKPFRFEGSFEERNLIVQLNKGEMHVGRKGEKVKEEAIYFVPQGQLIDATVGKRDYAIGIDSSSIDDEAERSTFLQNISFESLKKKKQAITVVSFDVILYNAIPLFPLLKISPFVMPENEEFSCVLRYLCVEDDQTLPGKKLLLKNYMQALFVQLYRYMDLHPKMHEHIVKMEFLNDKRLVDIFHYIQANLNKDLSNKAISKLIFVSEEYVGQFFKSLTNRNLQDYIEDQRMEKALSLLRSHAINVQEIAHKVGYRDAKYFSQRFKLKYGVNANAVRQKKTEVV
jgi:AraC-like DNA-binding protein